MLLLLSGDAAQQTVQEHDLLVEVVPYTRTQEHGLYVWVTAPQVVHQEHDLTVNVAAGGAVQEHNLYVWVSGQAGAGGSEPAKPPAVTVYAGQAPWPMMVSCALGVATGGSYTWNGTTEEATLTFAVDVEPDDLGTEIELWVKSGGRGLSRRLTVDRGQYSQQVGDDGGIETTIRLYNPGSVALENAQTPEFIPWHLDEGVLATGNTPREPRTVPVASVVRDIFAAAGLALYVRGGNALSSARWQEGTRDYSTAGVTPKAAFDATYGLLGYTLVLDGWRAYAYPPGFEGRMTTVECRDLAVTRQLTRALGGMPSRLELSGPDQTVTWEPPPGGNWQNEPEVTSDWAVQTDGVVTTYNRTVMRGNLLLGQDEITTADIEVLRVAEGGESYVDRYSDALMTATLTRNLYHPEFPEALLRSETTKYTIGYHPMVKVLPVNVAGLDLMAGDVIPTDTSLNVKQWYDPYDPDILNGDLLGYLKVSHTMDRKLKSFLQDRPQTKEAGPLLPGEYSAQSRRDEYVTKDGKLWTKISIQSGGGNIPVNDLATGESVYLAERTSNQLLEVDPGVTPERVSMRRDGKGSGPQPVELPLPLRWAGAVGGGVRDGGGTESIAFGWAETTEQLASYAPYAVRRWAPRETLRQPLTRPLSMAPGERMQVGGHEYTVTEVSVEVGEAPQMTVGAMRFLDPLSVSPAPLRQPGEKRGIYRGRKPDGLWVMIPNAAGGWTDITVQDRGREPQLHTPVTLGFSASGYTYIKETG